MEASSTCCDPRSPNSVGGARRRGFRSPGRLPDKHPVRPGRQGIVFTNLPGNWMPVADAGWTIYWIDRGQIPIGAQALPEYFMDRSITDFVHEFWRIQTIDKRLVGDIILNRTRQTAPMIIVTSNTGGVGKTVSSRRLCERAREKGLRPLLIDGNMRQSSQRSFFDPGSVCRRAP